MTAVRRFLDDLDAALVPSLPIPPPESDEPARDDERSSLLMDWLWTDQDYPEYGQGDVLRAYRLGAADQRQLHYARLSALPSLTSVLRAVADLADEFERETANRRRVANATPCCDAADRLRAVLGGEL